VRPRILERGDMGRIGSMSDVADETIKRWFDTDTPRPDLVERCRARLMSDDWYSWSANWKAISELDNLAELADVRAPALVVAGERDLSIPVAASASLADSLAHSRMVSVPGAAHFGAFDRIGEFKPIFDDFLSGVIRQN
jgi:3-oxoadipate enol-lactonase